VRALLIKSRSGDTNGDDEAANQQSDGGGCSKAIHRGFFTPSSGHSRFSAVSAAFDQQPGEQDIGRADDHEPTATAKTVVRPTTQRPNTTHSAAVGAERPTVQLSDQADPVSVLNQTVTLCPAGRIMRAMAEVSPTSMMTPNVRELARSVPSGGGPSLSYRCTDRTMT